MSALKICPQCGTEYELDQRFCPKDGSTLKLQNAAGDLVGSIIADRYHVMRKLGEGGMGTVYLAEHVKMGRKSAVKVMNPGMVNDSDAISRFNREAANASRINHPNVASVYDFGETSDGLIYLAMEFIEGPSLTKVIEDLGSLPPARAADITRQAADALTVAHDMGIVHRDLKPDNIMLTKNRDGSDCVKVVDFGIAKAANSEAQKVTKTGLVVGTPEYMSPEQLAGDKLDGRSDLYSLALVSFAMLTGKLPFPGETAQESMIARLTDAPKTLAEMKPDVAWPAEVQAVMDKALERDAATRYQSAADFGRELNKAIERMPETALTNAFTAVMSPPAAPVAAPGKTAAQLKTPSIPPTRVHQSTPVAPIPAAKSKTPMVATIAAVVVAVIAGGGYFAMKGGGAKADAAQQGAATATKSPAQGDTKAGPQGTSTGEGPASGNVARELEDLMSRPADTTAAMGRTTLSLLEKLEERAKVAPESTYLQFRYARGKALMASGDEKAGCDSLNNIQGKLGKSRFKAAASFVLNYCSQR